VLPARFSSTGAVAVILLGISLGSTTRAGSPGAGRAYGEHIARLACSACHVVARDQEFPPILNWPTPSFFDIANTPQVSRQTLQRFIARTHWDGRKLPMTMPNPQLTQEQAQAVAQYILSLRGQVLTR